MEVFPILLIANTVQFLSVAPFLTWNNFNLSMDKLLHLS